MTPLRVAAVVVTHNRREVLAETLRAACIQTRPSDRIYVVDNASDDGTGELLRTEFPEVTHQRIADNLGAGGRARGIEAAWSDGFDAFWLVDDDSAPHADALETLLAAAERGSDRIGMVGCQGGVIRFGLIRHLDDRSRLERHRVADDLFAVDFALLDGSLVLRRTVEQIGVPRVDYFIMMEDVEYPLRAQRAGFEVLIVGRDLMSRAHLGSTAATRQWRSYYQSRNHLRMALDFRSPSLLFGCALRQARFVVAGLSARDQRWLRIKLRLRGLWDGLRGRMGRRVEPDAASP
jgi:rhamnopyranosyl-N-acetylglucosaminyl-diphospho-decaprenol beta-1,3/1,4-galactofuranosyltransferase